MKINNIVQIRADDFPSETRQTVEQLGNILNPFMQQVEELQNGRIDYENMTHNFIQIEMTVDSSGVPVLNDKINTGKVGIRGFNVVRAYGASNNSIGATSQPFINFIDIGGGTVQVTSITGLPANTKMVLNIEIK